MLKDKNISSKINFVPFKVVSSHFQNAFSSAWVLCQYLPPALKNEIEETLWPLSL